jgi:hypothetical protein
VIREVRLGCIALLTIYKILFHVHFVYLLVWIMKNLIVILSCVVENCGIPLFISFQMCSVVCLRSACDFI